MRELREILTNVDEIKNTFPDYYDFVAAGKSYDATDEARWIDCMNLIEIVSRWVHEYIKPFINSITFDVDIIKAEPGTMVDIGETTIKTSDPIYSEGSILGHICDAVTYAAIPLLFTNINSDKIMNGKGHIVVTNKSSGKSIDIDLSQDYKKFVSLDIIEWVANEE